MASGNPPNQNPLIEIPREVFLGWKSRGYLPHFESPEKIQHVTFHLGDSLPREVVKRLRDEVCNLPLKKQTIELRKRLEAWVDAGHGSCLLQQPLIADLVQNTLHFHNNICLGDHAKSCSCFISDYEWMANGNDCGILEETYSHENYGLREIRKSSQNNFEQTSLASRVLGSIHP